MAQACRLYSGQCPDSGRRVGYSPLLAVRGRHPRLQEALAQCVTDHLTQALQVVLVHRDVIDGETRFPDARGTLYAQGERWS